MREQRVMRMRLIKIIVEGVIHFTMILTLTVNRSCVGKDTVTDSL